MKKFSLFVALLASLVAVNSYACDAEKKEGKDKAPQAQSEGSAPGASTQQAGK